eukprot:956790-Pyramimonas_sp.AAC.1
MDTLKKGGGGGGGVLGMGNAQSLRLPGFGVGKLDSGLLPAPAPLSSPKLSTHRLIVGGARGFPQLPLQHENLGGTRLQLSFARVASRIWNSGSIRMDGLAGPLEVLSGG